MKSQPKTPAKTKQPAFTSEQLFQISAIGYILGLLYYSVAYWITESRQIECSLEWFGFCSVGGLAGVMLALLINAGLGTVILRMLRVKHYISIVIMATVLLCSIPPLLEFFYGAPLLVIIIHAAIINGLMYGLFYWFFNATKLDPTNKLIIAVVTAVLALIGSSHFGYIAEQQRYERNYISPLQKTWD